MKMEFSMCLSILLYIWIVTLYHVVCYEQLVISKQTKVQSSSVYNTSTYSASANKTIDKKRGQNIKDCMHTAVGKNEAWLRIDLGSTYNLKSVKIWYRNDRGSKEINTERLKGFSIFASKNPGFDGNHACFQDPENATLETEFEVDCFGTAQFVEIYTNKTNNGDGGPILEICEVEIFGCPRKKYGEGCVSCDTCKNDCDITGQCDIYGCLHDGYTPPFCRDCRHGKYGESCNKTCGHCFGNSTCNSDDGHCPYTEHKLCEPGWKNVWKCDKECDDGAFGMYCNEMCKGHCAGELPCNKSNGLCTDGCAEGWEGTDCTKRCESGRYGKDCKEECGYCEGDQTCDHVSGFCPALCEPGYQGEKCIEKCESGKYGIGCKEVCGQCDGNKPCNHINGSCRGSCEPGYYGETCHIKCNPGFYGKDCQQKCGQCGGETICSSINGACPDSCKPGYQGKRCKRECDYGKYGFNCSKNCSGHCARGLNCSIIDGSCAEGCEDGWKGTQCSTMCSSGRYGKDCKEKCGHCGENIQCNNINGSCYGICETGYQGEKCVTKKLVKPGYTRASSSSIAYKYEGYPKKTVDGDVRQNPYTYCMHTEPHAKEAWLRIDLRKIYNIHSVMLWYRNDSIEPGYNTRRIQGFHIRLSNTTQVDRLDICYQDDGMTILPPIIEQQCKGIAQYVWIYTNKTDTDGAILEICEIQVLGCSYQDRDGNCISCDQCKNDCNIKGECDELGCKMDGYHLPYCKECRNGRYGNDCSLPCGHCAKNATCNNITGSCPNKECAPGWKYTDKCNQECNDGTFGKNCSSSCRGHCANGTVCSKVNGLCPSGCAPGWKSSDCSQQCKEGFYGINCSHSCGLCSNHEHCDHETGSCPSGLCEPGWKITENRKCNQKCSGGFYGINCSRSCGRCSQHDEHCDHETGSCPSGLCEPGWKITEDRKCNQECNNGSYGKNCTHPCGHCTKNATCDHVTGSCPNGYCELGWKHTSEQRCDQECDNGTFGLYCEQNCSGHCAGGLPCSKVNGYCPRGCNDGWINSYCNKTCKKYFYGKNCTLRCGNCAKGAICDHVNGSCPDGQCEHGWKHTPDKRCSIECPKGSYGKKCEGICGYCGGNDICDHISGSCPNLCAPGFQTEKCDTECDNGTFGLRCNFTCSKGCFYHCNKINGTCDRCHYGFIGEFCNITVAESQVQDLTPTVAGVAIFLVIFVIAVIVLVIVLARKSRKKKADEIELPDRKGTPKSDLLKNKPEDKENKTENGGPMEENAEIEYIVTDNGQKKTLIKIADLGRIIKIFSMEENKKFTEEFKGIPYGEQQHIPCSVAKLQQNMPKNRHKTTFPYDHSRVVLNVSPDNDYINANYIKDVEGKRRYIATQGPRKNTVQDFWAMIWQENIRVIVMVTKLTEGSTIKCEQYWPGQGEQMTSGQFCLQLMSQKDYANYTQRDINITYKKTKAVKTVNQVQFTAWPDHGTPSPIELLVFYRHVMRFTRMYPECPLVVHCSAGIGRTGTFIALDALYKHGQKEGKIDIVEYVKIMREDRMNMIQNAGQYVFLYKALYEIFKTNGRLVNKEEFIKEVTSQLMSNKAANASQFKKEFNELLSIKPVLDENDTKDGRQNIDLNMTKTVLPADSIRVLLTSYARGRGNYYNAVPISSYTLRDGLIAAQYPVEGAAVDLVRLLIDQECTILVSINQLSDIASSAEWMTTSAEKSVISPYKTMLGTCTGRSLSNKLKMTVLKMKHEKDSEWHTVKVLEILNWKINEKLPADEDVLIELMNKVQEIIKDPDTKIIVLSRDGATGCGIFCAVYNAIQQLQQDNEVDMFTIVRQLQMRRPEMISSMSEYQCCCQVVANFFSAHKDDIYENAQGRQEVTKQDENIYANTSS